MKLLADSSIWIDHLRERDETLARALREKRILIHPFVIGEVAMGSIARRDDVLAGLADLRMVGRADDAEVLDMVDRHQLFGSGIGLLDAHLLAATLLTPETRLWTRDRRLKAAATQLGIAAGLR